MKLSKFVSNFDYLLFFSTIILTITGILFIYSANLNKAQTIQDDYLKQIFILIVSLMILTLILFVTPKNIQKYALWFYLICILGLVITLFFPDVKGQRRFTIFSFSLQFSEYMKIASILLLAKFYANKSHNEIRKIKTYLQGLLIVLIPMGLIILQPDLGTLLVYLPIFLGISFFAGVKKRYILFTLLLIFFVSFIPVITSINKLFFNNENPTLSLFTNTKYVIIVFSSLAFILILSILGFFDLIKGISGEFKIFFYWIIFIVSTILIGGSLSYPVNSRILKPYQKDRLMIFFNPNVDPKGKGYNIIQSQTTIGNGGLFGKGWCKGEQIQNFFLPEQATDFIFPVIAEEKGFFGSIFILFLYSIIFFRALIIILYAKNYWEAYVVIGILIVYLYHILQNIGMTIGIMPITGIPLPFLSYGGSFLMTCFIGIAIILNIELNRYQY